MKLKFSLNSNTVVTLVLLLALTVFFFIYAGSEKAIDRANVQRQLSINLVVELRQSSDDLTRMVRTYVVTGDPAFKRYFQTILDIRNGVEPRPSNYQEIYWDFISAGLPPPTPAAASAFRCCS